MPANKLPAASSQQPVIERASNVPRAAEFKGRKHRSRCDAVAVDLAAGREAGMKRLWDKSAAQDPNLWRERRVQGRRQDRRIESCRQIHVRALSERMDSGVRPSSAMHPNSLPHDLGKGCLEPVLNRVAIDLTLPTGEGGAVIGDD